MKIKLQDYSLISNELVQQIDSLLASNEDTAHGKESVEIAFVRKKLEQLIPAEKLAEICFDEGSETPRVAGSYPAFDNSTNQQKEKQLFLNSEIEIE